MELEKIKLNVRRWFHKHEDALEAIFFIGVYTAATVFWIWLFLKAGEYIKSQIILLPPEKQPLANIGVLLFVILILVLSWTRKK